MSPISRHYSLYCPVCRQRFSDEKYLLSCPNGCNSLLRTEYKRKDFHPLSGHGIFKYKDWLPVEDIIKTQSGPICYKSEKLAEILNLKNLWISFSGYWPERDANVISCSFKEFEAYPTMQRRKECNSGIILVASAGNTARAFAEVSAKIDEPVIVVVPKSAIDKIYTSNPAKNVFLIAIDGDYTDAINYSDKLCSIDGIVAEGGAKNIARRDGMGTVMLEAVRCIGHLPDWYIQGVGSGTGGIAAWEAAIRLIQTGNFGETLPKLLLIQNYPFTPITNAYMKYRRKIEQFDLPGPDEESVYAPVLTNRAPPYSIVGGVYDALIETDGIMGSVTNAESIDAFSLFQNTEGIDIDPAAAVSVAGLIKAVYEGKIDSNSCILLNITGGGYIRRQHEVNIFHKTPDVIVNYLDQDIKSEIKEFLNKYE